MAGLTCALIIFTAGLCFTARADHLPEALQARGKPETTLAGINLKGATLADIIRHYGQPTKVKAWEQDNPNIANSYDYYWVRSGLSLHVVIQRSRESPNWEYVSLLEVGAGTSRKTGKTGKALRLGDTLKDLKRIYGRRFHERNIPKLKIHDVMIQWRREEYSLVATLDRHNRVTGLSLAAPE